MKSLNDWTKEELLALPVRAWNAVSTYESVLLLSTGEAHDSGWACMAVIGLIDRKPIEIASICSDDIEWQLPPMQYAGLGQLRMDCTLSSGAIHAWNRDALFVVGAALSSITIELRFKS